MIYVGPVAIDLSPIKLTDLITAMATILALVLALVTLWWQKCLLERQINTQLYQQRSELLHRFKQLRDENGIEFLEGELYQNRRRCENDMLNLFGRASAALVFRLFQLSDKGRQIQRESRALLPGSPEHTEYLKRFDANFYELLIRSRELQLSTHDYFQIVPLSRWNRLKLRHEIWKLKRVHKPPPLSFQPY